MPDEAPRARARLAQQRSRERRRDILDAALRRYLDGGRANVTHRSVAEEAQVPLASVGYYFASLEDLVEEALTTALERVTEEVRALDLADRPLEQVLTVVHDFFMSDGDAGRLATWRLLVGSITMPRSSAAVAQLIEAIHDALAEALGRPDDATPTLALLLLMGQDAITTGDRSLRPRVDDALRLAVARMVEDAGTASALEHVIETSGR